jgi:hypothetical protein
MRTAAEFEYQQCRLHLDRLAEGVVRLRALGVAEQRASAMAADLERLARSVAAAAESADPRAGTAPPHLPWSVRGQLD